MGAATYFSPAYRDAMREQRAQRAAPSELEAMRTENEALRARVAELEALLEQSTAPAPSAQGERRTRR